MLMRNFWLRHVGFIALVLAASSAAVGSTVTAQTAAPTGTLNAVRPVIQAQLNGSTLPGAPSSYCWLQPGQTPCVQVDNPQPSVFTSVKANDTITFTVMPSGEQPSTLTARLLDDTDASNNPIQIDLSKTQGVYTVDTSLPNGNHRIEVEADYPPAADGSQPYVSYVFGIQLGAGGIATPGQTSTTAATTGAVSTSEATGNATGNATSGGTAAATTSPTAIPPTATPTNTPSPLPTATETPSLTPSNTSTTVPTNTSTFTPSPTLTPSYTPTDTPTMTNTPIVPVLTLNVGDQSYGPVAVTALVQDTSGALITITRPVDSATPIIKATTSTDAQIQFTGPTPISELATLTNADGTKVINQQPLAAGSNVVYALPAQPGLYALYVAVQWPQGQATYIFRLQIS